MSRETLILNNYDTDKSYPHTTKHSNSYLGCILLKEGVRTIREGVLMEEGALTEVVRYVYSVSLASTNIQ